MEFMLCLIPCLVTKCSFKRVEHIELELSILAFVKRNIATRKLNAKLALAELRSFLNSVYCYLKSTLRILEKELFDCLSVVMSPTCASTSLTLRLEASLSLAATRQFLTMNTSESVPKLANHRVRGFPLLRRLIN